MFTVVCFFILLAAYCFYEVVRDKKVASRNISRYESMLAPIGIKEVNQSNLIRVDSLAREKVFSLLEKVALSEKQVYDSNSSLGICGYTKQTENRQ